MRTLSALIALTIALPTVACVAGENDDASADESAVTTGSVTETVRQRLMVRAPSEQGRTWQITEGNLLTGDWLLQMPRTGAWGTSSLKAPIACKDTAHCDKDFNLVKCSSDAECGGGACTDLEAAGEKLCTGHSDSILDEIYGVMTRTNASLDVTSLSAPTGKYLATMRHALTALDAKNTPITVRFLFGDFPHNEPDLAGILGDVTRDLKPGTKVSVSIGSHQHSPTSWNHSKIIVADGREAIIGGMNLWDAHYLEANPVHDVSLHVRGPVAVSSQKYVNELWAVPCGSGKIMGNKGNACPKMFAPTAAPAPVGNTRMIAVGRLGNMNRNPSDTALVAMMDAARSTIRISQQDIGSVKVFLGGVLPEDYLDAWTRAARRGVDVTIAVSNEGAYGGGGTTTADSYFNGYELKDLWRGLVARADQQWPDSHEQLCKHVHFERMRSISAPTWASGLPQANHAKVVIVDDQAHYVGSQNLYDANLAEFGVIVDDQTATKQFISDYWTNLSKSSAPTAYLDPECR